MKNKVNDELKQHFRPEFLNRVDDIIVFHQLTQEEIVADRRPHDRQASTSGSRTRTWASSSRRRPRTLLAKQGFDPVLGARPLRRTIQREIEDQLSEKILFGEVEPGQIVMVDVEGEGKAATFTFTGTAAPRTHRPPGRGDGGRHQRLTGPVCRVASHAAYRTA